MRNTLETRLGIFVALCIVAAIVILEMVGVAEYFKPGYLVHANFRSIQELKPGDLVRMAGVEVGRVQDISLTNEQVRVTMKIKKPAAAIRTTSKATIRFVGLMGQNFVSIDFGTPEAPRVQPGAILGTTEQSDLSSLMTKLESVADEVKVLRKDLSTENLASLMGPLTHFMEQNSTNLNAILGNVRKVTDQVAEGKGTAGKLLFDDTLYDSALATVASVQAGANELKSIALDARGLLNDVNAGKGNLGLLVKDDALYRETTNTMVNFREIMQKVNRGDGTVGKLINDDSFLKNAKVSLQKLDKATEGLEDQGPLSLMGTLVNTLF
ncbi:MAG: MCE family protein [Verrucomicrobia bacterium]|nr:MCE family protein [Verrucomicrobiota bacterium]